MRVCKSCEHFDLAVGLGSAGGGCIASLEVRELCLRLRELAAAAQAFIDDLGRYDEEWTVEKACADSEALVLLEGCW